MKSLESMLHRPLERSLGLRRHDPVGGGDLRLTVVGLARRTCTVEPQRIAPRLHRILIATEPHVDRRDDVPATTILRIALQMGLDLRDQAVDRAGLGRRTQARSERCAGKIG